MRRTSSLAKILSLALAACSLTADAFAGPPRPPSALRCEWEVMPYNVERAAPRLSWRSHVRNQAAYQIQVASDEAALMDGGADLWDSDRVESSVSMSIPYAGKPLASRAECWWRVRVWEKGVDVPSDWSDPTYWRMGLLHANDWRAKWIRAADRMPVEETPELTRWLELAGHSVDKDGEPSTAGADRLRQVAPASLFRRTFTIPEGRRIDKAFLYSTAAGYIELYLDGKRIGNRVMNPAQTDFEKRILYDVDDLRDRLSPGKHVLTAHLGEGFYGQGVAFRPAFRYGDPALLLQLEIACADGATETIATDERWETRPSPVVKNNVYAGEVHDARRTAIGAWTPAVVADTPPTERLEAQRTPPVMAINEVRPTRILAPKPGAWVFDFGRNFTGVPTLNLRDQPLPEGTAVYLRYAEWADEDGNISQTSDGAFATTVHQVDAYIADGATEAPWTPSFTWHGFRYVEVTGLPGKPSLDFMTAHLLRSNVQRRGDFSCSDPLIERAHDTAVWTWESNLISIPSDCPIRERCGWTGDAHATLTMANGNFEMPTFWEKYLGDFATSPHISPCIVPGRRGASSTPDWAVAQVLIAWEHYLHYGDAETLRMHYERLNAFMDHYASLREDGVITVGYGDWCDPVRTPGTPRVGGAGRPQQTPPAVTTTALFVYASDLMRDIADVLGDADKSEQYAAWRDETARAFHERFYDADAQTYGSQTADAMALSFGITPDALRAAVARSLNDDVLVNWNGHASVGALGHRWLYEALSDAGYADTALGAFHAKGHPGFHYLFDDLRGTTLWERKGAFDPKTMDAPERSLSHPFQGGYDAWFQRGLGGVRPAFDSPGYKHFYLRPCFPKQLDTVDVSLETPYGRIRSSWRRDGDAIVWSVEVPANTSATVRLPNSEFDGRVLPPGSHEMTLANGN